MYFPRNQYKYRKGLIHFVRLLSLEGYIPVRSDVGGNTKAGISIEQTRFRIASTSATCFGFKRDLIH